MFSHTQVISFSYNLSTSTSMSANITASLLGTPTPADVPKTNVLPPRSIDVEEDSRYVHGARPKTSATSCSIEGVAVSSPMDREEACAMVTRDEVALLKSVDLTKIVVRTDGHFLLVLIDDEPRLIKFPQSLLVFFRGELDSVEGFTASVCMVMKRSFILVFLACILNNELNNVEYISKTSRVAEFVKAQIASVAFSCQANNNFFILLYRACEMYDKHMKMNKKEIRETLKNHESHFIEFVQPINLLMLLDQYIVGLEATQAKAKTKHKAVMLPTPSSQANAQLDPSSTLNSPSAQSSAALLQNPSSTGTVSKSQNAPKDPSHNKSLQHSSPDSPILKESAAQDVPRTPSWTTKQLNSLWTNFSKESQTSNLQGWLRHLSTSYPNPNITIIKTWEEAELWCPDILGLGLDSSVIGCLGLPILCPGKVPTQLSYELAVYLIEIANSFDTLTEWPAQVSSAKPKPIGQKEFMKLNSKQVLKSSITLPTEMCQQPGTTGISLSPSVCKINIDWAAYEVEEEISMESPRAVFHVERISQMQRYARKVKQKERPCQEKVEQIEENSDNTYSKLSLVANDIGNKLSQLGLVWQLLFINLPDGIFHKISSRSQINALSIAENGQYHESVQATPVNYMNSLLELLKKHVVHLYQHIWSTSIDYATFPALTKLFIHSYLNTVGKSEQGEKQLSNRTAAEVFQMIWQRVIPFFTEAYISDAMQHCITTTTGEMLKEFVMKGDFIVKQQSIIPLPYVNPTFSAGLPLDIAQRPDMRYVPIFPPHREQANSNGVRKMKKRLAVVKDGLTHNLKATVTRDRKASATDFIECKKGAPLAKIGEKFKSSEYQPAVSKHYHKLGASSAVNVDPSSISLNDTVLNDTGRSAEHQSLVMPMAAPSSSSEKEKLSSSPESDVKLKSKDDEGTKQQSEPTIGRETSSSTEFPKVTKIATTHKRMIKTGKKKQKSKLVLALEAQQEKEIEDQKRAELEDASKRINQAKNSKGNPKNSNLLSVVSRSESPHPRINISGNDKIKSPVEITEDTTSSSTMTVNNKCSMEKQPLSLSEVDKNMRTDVPISINLTELTKSETMNTAEATSSSMDAGPDDAQWKKLKVFRIGPHNAASNSVKQVSKSTADSITTNGLRPGPGGRHHPERATAEIAQNDLTSATSSDIPTPEAPHLLVSYSQVVSTGQHTSGEAALSVRPKSNPFAAPKNENKGGDNSPNSTPKKKMKSPEPVRTPPGPSSLCNISAKKTTTDLSVKEPFPTLKPKTKRTTIKEIIKVIAKIDDSPVSFCDTRLGGSTSHAEPTEDLPTKFGFNSDERQLQNQDRKEKSKASTTEPGLDRSTDPERTGKICSSDTFNGDRMCTSELPSLISFGKIISMPNLNLPSKDLPLMPTTAVSNRDLENVLLSDSSKTDFIAHQSSFKENGKQAPYCITTSNANRPSSKDTEKLVPCEAIPCISALVRSDQNGPEKKNEKDSKNFNERILEQLEMKEDQLLTQLNNPSEINLDRKKLNLTSLAMEQKLADIADWCNSVNEENGSHASRTASSDSLETASKNDLNNEFGTQSCSPIEINVFSNIKQGLVGSNLDQKADVCSYDQHVLGSDLYDELLPVQDQIPHLELELLNDLDPNDTYYADKPESISEPGIYRSLDIWNHPVIPDFECQAMNELIMLQNAIAANKPEEQIEMVTMEEAERRRVARVDQLLVSAQAVAGEALKISDDKIVENRDCSCLYEGYRNVFSRMEPQHQVRIGSYLYTESASLMMGQSGRVGVAVYIAFDERGKGYAAKRYIRPNDNALCQINMFVHSPHVLKMMEMFLQPRSLIVITEMCECNLKAFVESDDYKCGGINLRQRLCFEFLTGLEALHSYHIIHGSLKPENLLIGDDGMLKIGDYPACANWDAFLNCFSMNSLDALCWESTEMKRRLITLSIAPSDVQTAGMLIHYILCGGEHPFGKLDKPIVVDKNIRAGLYSIATPEPMVIHLLSWMITETLTQRRSAASCLLHPLFWSEKKQYLFMAAVGKQPEVRSGFSSTVASQINALQPCIGLEDWRKEVDSRLLMFLNTQANYRNTMADLLKFISDLHEQKIMPIELLMVIKDKCRFVMEKFSQIVLPVFNATVKSTLCLRPSIESVLNNHRLAVKPMECAE